MGWLGAILLMGGGLWGALLWCVEGRRRLRLGRELRRQLLALEREILVRRRPLGELVEELKREEGEASPFWAALTEKLAGEESFDRCWQGALEELVPPYGELLRPLGPALSLGEAGELLALAREELTQHLRQEGRSRRERERLAMVLGVSAGAMVAVTLI